MKKILLILFCILIFQNCGSKENKSSSKQQVGEYINFDTPPKARSPIVPLVEIEHPGASVMIQLLVDQNGSVIDANIMRSSLFPEIDASALISVKNTEFHPALLLEEAVEAWTEIELFFPANKKEPKAPPGMTSGEIDIIYQTQVTGALADLGIKLSSQQEVDFSINFKSKISESDNENSALHLQEEIDFLKNEIQNFIYHVNNEEGSLEDGVQIYQETSDSRITLIDQNGKVLADSYLEKSEIEKMENHIDRPEVIESGKSEYGISTRFSETLNRKFLYVAHGYEEDGDKRRIYIRFSKEMSEIYKQRALRVYENEIMDALLASDVALNDKQRSSFFAIYLKELKERLTEKNVNTDIEKNETVAKSFAVKLEANSQKVAEQLKIEIATIEEYLKNTKGEFQTAIQSYAQTGDFRVTLVNDSGVVIADSDVNRSRVASLSNHAARPEIAQSNLLPYGISSRFSQTMQERLVYVSHRLKQPIDKVRYIRLARSLRSDYSKIRVQEEDILKIYSKIILKSFNRSNIELDSLTLDEFSKRFYFNAETNNNKASMDFLVEYYRLYFEEIDYALFESSIELNPEQDSLFNIIYAENIEREFAVLKKMNVLRNESAFRVHLKNLEIEQSSLVDKKQKAVKRVLKNGPIITYHDNGRVKEKGQYGQGKKNGKWRIYNSKGVLVLIKTYEMGKVLNEEKPDQIIESATYHDNGRVKEQGLTRNGQRHGEWKKYDQKGDLVLVALYEMGKVMGKRKPDKVEELIEYHDNGRVKSQGLVKNKKRDGTWKIFDKRGKLIKTIVYADGKMINSRILNDEKPKLRDGSAVTYHKNGRIKETGKYSKGKKNGTWKEFDKRGKLLKVKIYNFGEVINEQAPEVVKPFTSYHDNGRIKEKGMMKNKKREGEWSLYGKNGKIVRTSFYSDGEIVNKTDSGLINPIKTYHENGFVKEYGILNDGKREGVWKIYTDDGKHIENITYDKGVIKDRKKI